MLKKTVIISLVFFLSANSWLVFAENKRQEIDNQELIDIAAPGSGDLQKGDAAGVEAVKTGFAMASESVHQRLQESIDQLNSLREKIAGEKLPLSRKLSSLESDLSKVRLEYRKTTRLLDSRTLDLSNLRSEIKSRKQESTYLSNLLGEYIRNFESRLHIAEIQRYRKPLEEARLAPENSSFTEEDIYKVQAGLLSLSLDRLHEAVGGSRFRGTATDSNGSICQGKFVLIGPAAIFQSDDGKIVGNVEQRLGSLEPAVIEFGDEADSSEAAKILSGSAGKFPIDPTGGNAHKIEETKETLLAHIKKGGPVMYPIFIMAGAALLVALFKWICLILTSKPAKKQVDSLLEAVAGHDEKAVAQRVKSIQGPVGEMLACAVEHIKEPRDLIEEVMYEKVLATRLRLERFLPFIAISAASAPLLGLLGTVTGIINTFKLLTVFGSGDVKALSGGISEALITTEFGLIVAIPSLLFHAFLSRKAKGMINEMEKAAVAFVNQVSKTPYRTDDITGGFAGLSADQARELLRNISIQPQQFEQEPIFQYADDSAGALMDTDVLKVENNATVAEAIDKIRSAEIGGDVDSVYAVDDQGRYTGNVLIRHLLIRPEDECVESLAESKSVFVRTDTHRDQVHTLLNEHGLVRLPVLDQDDQLIGQIYKNENGDGK